MEKLAVLPIPYEPDPEDRNERRLWIGNLDERVTEFTLLKLLQKYGKLEKFDFLYHIAGPDQGKPRGYCFATFSTTKESEDARKGLHGKLALSKRLVVRYATAKAQNDSKESKPKYLKSVSSISTDMSNMSNEVKIRAIEAKLKLMQQVEPGSSSSSSGPSFPSAAPKSSSSLTSSSSKHKHSQQKPYNKLKRL